MKKIFVLILLLTLSVSCFSQASGGQIRRGVQQATVQQRTSSSVIKKHANNEVFLEDGKTVIIFETSKAVDLGLPSGTIWAGYNIGATSPKEIGDYFAWGEIYEKENYSSADYFDIDKTGAGVGAAKFKKYSNNGIMSIIGTDRDVAQTKWGKPWSMPSKAQIDELKKYCSVYRVKCKGESKNFVLFKGPNGKSILFPYSGMKQGNNIYEDLGVYCWSGEIKPSEDFSHSAFCLFASMAAYPLKRELKSGSSFELRWYGLNVRAVKSNYHKNR